MDNKEALVTIVAFILAALVISQIVSCERNSREMKAKCLMMSNSEVQTLKCREIR